MKKHPIDRKWQPIETAPKDMYILVYAPINLHSIVTGDYTVHQIVMAQWDKYENAFCVFGTHRERPDEYSSSEVIRVRNPTHWMLLPEPPEVS